LLVHGVLLSLAGLFFIVEPLVNKSATGRMTLVAAREVVSLHLSSLLILPYYTEF
jgi:hypothetical protein